MSAGELPERSWRWRGGERRRVPGRCDVAFRPRPGDAGCQLADAWGRCCPALTSLLLEVVAGGGGAGGPGGREGVVGAEGDGVAVGCAAVTVAAAGSRVGQVVERGDLVLDDEKLRLARFSQEA